MRRFSKVMLIIACVIGVIGIGFSVGGAVMGATLESVDILQSLKAHHFPISHMVFWDDDDWDDDDWDSEHQIESESTNSDGNRVYNIASAEEAEIELRYDTLVLKAYDGDTIQVEVENDDAGNVKVAYDSKSLEIRSSRKVSNRNVIVSYPRDTRFQKMEIHVDAGTIDVQGDLYVEELDVEVGAGELTNEGSLTTGETNIQVGAGNADIRGLTAEKIDGECGLGAMALELTGKETDYNYKLEVGLGEIDLNGDSFSGLVGEKELNNGASRTVELECGMGEITIEFEDE